MEKYTVMHTGYPVAGRAIQPEEWKIYSVHKTKSAAWKKVVKAISHLGPGEWDDHYKVIGPDGQPCEYGEYLAEKETEFLNFYGIKSRK
jgi:hypothetical protein